MPTTRISVSPCTPTTHPTGCPFLPRVPLTSNSGSAERSATQPWQVRSTDRRHCEPAARRNVTPAVSSVSVDVVDLPVAEVLKALGVMLDRRLTFQKHVMAVARSCNYHSQACITATQCCTALHPAASRYFRERRTMQPGSSSRLHDVLMPAHYCGSCTGCLFNTESSTRSLCWPSKAAAAPQHRHTSLVTSRLASVNGYFAPLLHHYWTSRSPEWTLRFEPFAALHRPSGTRCLKQ